MSLSKQERLDELNRARLESKSATEHIAKIADPDLQAALYGLREASRAQHTVLRDLVDAAP